MAGPLQLAAAAGAADYRLAGGSPYGDYLAGLIAGRQKDLSAAADLMHRALDSDPENIALLRHTFILVAADGRHAEAVRLARRVIEHFPDDTSARLVLVVDQVERGELEKAAETLDGLPARPLGGVLVPDPGFGGAALSMYTDFNGKASISDTWPAGLLSGTKLYFQFWLPYFQGPQGYLASNAIVITVPG